ncbi:site-2 protease family protein [Piscirickettsia litoralis]|uniref:Peptidase M50 n=1 Tax=Piscirickettsia litoralis TaxID=1891921 RepID=A0ABX3A3Y8_9GAMM|nr:site-2 protease family protein [Piscirickettsia litoralis]ODN42366.1 peptidase M50 [Piscirickettsia litoralis]
MIEYLNTAVILIIPILTAIVFHEVGHGYAAKLLGDSTAANQGRLSLNPIAHIDPIGTIAVPALLYFTSGFLFGWAKPVPVNYNKLGSPRRDSALVAIAGPLVNFIFLFIWSILFAVSVKMQSATLYSMSTFGIQINIILIALNLLPIPPLDGSRVIASLLPPRFAYQYERFSFLGFILVILLAVSGIFSQYLSPLLNDGTLFFMRLFI